MAPRAIADSDWADSDSLEESCELHCLEECWDEPELPETRARMERERLQGRWLSVPGRHQAELLIAGEHYTVHLKDGAIYMGVFQLDVVRVPKTMAMRIEEGPAPYKGKTTWCIYELSGDTLHWCATRPGSQEQLDRFPSEYDPNYVCLTFRRS